MDPARVFREDEHRLSSIDTVLFSPVSDAISFIEVDVVEKSWEIETPFETTVSFLEVLSENSSPFRVSNVSL